MQIIVGQEPLKKLSEEVETVFDNSRRETLKDLEGFEKETSGKDVRSNVCQQRIIEPDDTKAVQALDELVVVLNDIRDIISKRAKNTSVANIPIHWGSKDISWIAKLAARSLRRAGTSIHSYRK
jgi:hypothetical protein